MLEPNTKAPDFTLKDAEGNERSLSDFKGKNVILYFYPKDNTSGCTVQANNYKDHFDQFENQDAVVIGISKDTARSHANFAAKYGLPFVLLADPDRKVLGEYGVLKDATMYGKPVVKTIRTTYLIDKDGMIRHVTSPADPKTDPQKQLELLKTL